VLLCAKTGGPSCAQRSADAQPVGIGACTDVARGVGEPGANRGVELYGGWPMILSGLKTLLETGEPLTTPDSLRYSGASA
jgi:hypothetical protein